MFIFDIKDQIIADLVDKKRVLLQGIAGAGKSITVNALKEMGNVVMLTPKNALKYSHENRFNVPCYTYDSAVRSPNKTSLSYDYENKQYTTDNIDFLILDEVFSVSPALLYDVLRQATCPVLMLGDEYQTSRDLPPEISADKVYTVDKSLRGTDENRAFIEIMYNLAKSYNSCHVAKLIKIMDENNINWEYGFPVDNGQYIGYTYNSVSEYMLSKYKNVPREKIISGKHTALDAERAPIVGQAQRELIQKVVGNDIKFAHPKSHVSHITCIGVEISGKYDVCLPAKHSTDTRALYTLLSRQNDLKNLTVYLYDFDSLPEHTFKTFQNSEKGRPVLPNQYFLTSTKDHMLIDKNVCDTTIGISISSWQEVLKQADPNALISIGAIYCEDGVKLVPEYKVKDNKDNTQKGDVTAQVVAELLRFEPNLVCDPTYLQVRRFKKNSASEYDENPTIGCYSNNMAKPLTYMQNPDDDEIGQVADIKASYWQILANYGQYIGVGPMYKYDPEKPMKHLYGVANLKGSNELMLINNHYYNYDQLTNKRIVCVNWYAMRPNTLQLTDEQIEHIHYTRQVRFEKSRLNKWGLWNKPRYVNSKTVSDHNVVVDNGKSSALYAMIIDIQNAQAILTSVLAEKYGAKSTCVDAVKGLTKNDPRTIINGVEVPDHDFDGQIYAPHMGRALTEWLEKYQKQRKGSHHTKPTKKEMGVINKLIELGLYDKLEG